MHCLLGFAFPKDIPAILFEQARPHLEHNDPTYLELDTADACPYYSSKIQGPRAHFWFTFRLQANTTSGKSFEYSGWRSTNIGECT
jgi:hypothetical protein